MLEDILLFYGRKLPLQRGKIRVVDALWPLIIRRKEYIRTATLCSGNYRIRCDLRDLIQRQLYFFGTYFHERELLHLWIEAARKSFVIFDVGANVGIYSLAASAENRAAQIHAFEPTPEIADQLKKTLIENAIGNVHVQQIAVSSAAGEASLVRYRGDQDANGGMNYIRLRGASIEDEGISTVSIDEYCRANKIEEIDLLKLDIQGHEAEALLGAEFMIANRKIRTVFLELNWSSSSIDECVATNCIDRLDAAGYQFSKPEIPLKFKNRGAWMRGLGDVIASRGSVSGQDD